MLAVLAWGCEHHAGSCTVFPVHITCCQQCECPPSSLHLLFCLTYSLCELVLHISRWSSGNQGNGWRALGMGITPLPAHSICFSVLVQFLHKSFAGVMVLIALYICALEFWDLFLFDKGECIPVSEADSSVKHVFFVVSACWFKSSLFAAVLSSCQGKHSKW